MFCEITNKLTLNSVELLIDDFTTLTASISHVILTSAMFFFTISNYEVMESCRFSDLTDEEIWKTFNEYLGGKYFQSIE